MRLPHALQVVPPPSIKLFSAQHGATLQGSQHHTVPHFFSLLFPAAPGSCKLSANLALAPFSLLHLCPTSPKLCSLVAPPCMQQLAQSKSPFLLVPQPPLWKGYDIQVYKTANRQTKQTPSITGGFASLSRAQIGKSISWLSKWGFQSVLFKLSVGTSRNQSMPLSTTQMGHKLTCLSPTTSHIF